MLDSEQKIIVIPEIKKSRLSTFAETGFFVALF